MLVALLLQLLLLGNAAADTILFPSYIASHMVIQRGEPFALKGVAGAHAVLTATVDGEKHTGSADATGAFSVSLPSRKASTTPIKIAVSSSAGGAARLEDVLVGDVYVSSGQSNMALPVLHTFSRNKSRDLLQSGKGPDIRIHGLKGNMNKDQVWSTAAAACEAIPVLISLPSRVRAGTLRRASLRSFSQRGRLGWCTPLGGDQ